MKAMRGKTWVFRGVLDVDWEICPYSISHELRTKGAFTKEGLGRYCMTKVDPDFPRKVQPGDFIVAEHMGFGHDHDHACLSIIGAGVAAVICETAGPYFLRNSIDRGLPVVELPGILNDAKQGDELEVNIETGLVRNLSSGVELRFEPMPTFIVERLEAGGVMPLLEREWKAGRLPKRLEGR